MSKEDFIKNVQLKARDVKSMTDEEKAEEKFYCDKCKDTGMYEKDEWANEDDSYVVEVKCGCGIADN